MTFLPSFFKISKMGLNSNTRLYVEFILIIIRVDKVLSPQPFMSINGFGHKIQSVFLKKITNNSASLEY